MQKMKPPTTWKLVDLQPQDGLGPHRADWDRLNDQLMGAHPLLASSFVEPLLRQFGETGVVLAMADQGGHVIAMLLLNRQPRALGVWSSFLPSQMQIGPTLLPPKLEIGGLLAVLPGYAAELDLLCNDPHFCDLRDLPGRPAESMPHALTMSVNLRGGFDDYWAQRPRKLIQNMRRYLRRLQGEGEGQGDGFRVIAAPEDMDAAVARYALLEGSGWKGREGTAITSSNAQGRFYAELMRTCAAQGHALVYELWHGQDLLASRMLLIKGTMVVMLKTAFHEAFDRFAPGRVLLLRTLEDLFKRVPDGVVEFYTNAEADLLAWSTSQRWINHVSIYRHTGLRLCYDGLRRVGRAWAPRKDRHRVDADVMVERSGATVERIHSVRELPPDAIALLDRNEQVYIEFGADWFELLSDTVFRDGAKSIFYVLRRQGHVLAVLPVGVQQTAAGHQVGALANYYTTLYALAADDGLDADDLLPVMMALRRDHRASAYRFWPMDPQSREFKLLRASLRQAGLKPRGYFAFGNWYLQVDSDWAGYLKNRSGQLRSTIKRMTKRLAAEDGGRLEIIRDEADVERGIAAYEAVYGASWKVAEPYVEFIPGLIRLCARRGWLRLGLAWIGDKPIAAQLWIVQGGRANIYKVAYDEAYKAIAPGTLVTALLLEEVIDRDQVAEVDYLIGDDAYKKTWMSHRRERFGLVAYDPLTARGLAGLTRQAVGGAWRRLRQKFKPPADNPAG